MYRDLVKITTCDFFRVMDLAIDCLNLIFGYEWIKIELSDWSGVTWKNMLSHVFAEL